jgi:hypothetical protein
MTMNENMKIYEQVRAVPKEALKEIKGGRLKGMSDINPMWRIKLLTEMFGICGIGWKIEIVDKRLEQGSHDQIVCFVDINLYIKVDGEWSAAIQGMGGSSFIAKESSGLFTSDECFKMAYTDAISVACKSLGFAADVYYANDRTKYSTPNEPEKAPKNEIKTDIPPQTLKNKYQTYKGSLEGIEEWIKGQQGKGHNFKHMEEILAVALNKRVEEQKANAK